MITTTLNEIRKHSPCSSGWSKLLTHLGKTKADNEPLSLLTVLDSNGIDDTLWCLRVLPDSYLEGIQRLALSFAHAVRHLMKDKCSIAALDTIERYLDGKVTKYKLAHAAVDAAHATYVVAYAAHAAHAAHAAYTAYAAAEAAAYAADAAYTAYAAAEAAAYAADAADAVAYAADAVARTVDAVIDLDALIQQAIREEPNDIILGQEHA